MLNVFFSLTTKHLVWFQPRGRVPYMVSICGENVHSSQYLLTHSGIWHDESGQSLCHSATQHVRSEEHLCPRYVRELQLYRYIKKNKSVSVQVHLYCVCVLFLLMLLSGFRSFLACLWHLQMGIFTSIMWIHRMEASVSLFKSTGVYILVGCTGYKYGRKS